MRVVIVGGSIAGLTLAHCLDKAQIDYILLEQKEELAPQEGASIGIMPNGGRILDQLGLYDRIEALVEPLARAHVTFPDGFHFSSRYPAVLQERFGFPLAFLDRQKVLEILAAAPVRSGRVRLGRRVVGVEPDADGVRVTTGSGDSYGGDLVVGADGVHSRVRAEMWRLGRASPEEGRFADEDKQMTMAYACVFGISSPIEQLAPGTQLTCYRDGWSVLAVIGQGGRIFWFLFLKLDRTGAYADRRRFGAADARGHCRRLAAAVVWEGVRFGEIWARCDVFQMTGLDEGVYSQWHWRNVVCIGDSMHKFAPHIGQGANCAIEDAALLSNRLRRWRAADGRPARLPAVLAAFADERLRRLRPLAGAARAAMRLHARDGLANRLLGRYLLPYAGDRPAAWAARGIAAGVVLDFVAPPARGGPGWAPRRRRAPAGRLAACLVVALAGLCLAALGAGMRSRMGLEGW